MISIIIPTYNNSDTINKCLSAIFSQTFKDFEVIIIDDNSSDDTINLCRSFIKSNTKITILKNDKNYGAGITRSRGISIAKGEYISFCDSDDYWMPDKLKLQMYEFKNNKNIGIVFSSFKVFDEGGKLKYTKLSKDNLNIQDFFYCNWIGTSTAIFKKNLKKSDKMPDLRKRQDYAFWFNILKYNDIVVRYINKPLVKYTDRKNSISSSNYSNLISNYYMWHKYLKYNIIKSILFCLLNIYSKLNKKYIKK